MEDPLDRVRADLSALEEKIAFHSAEKDRAEKAAQDLRTAIRVFDSYASGERAAPPPRAGQPSNTELVSNIAAENIRLRRHRTPVAELLALAENAGIRIPGSTQTAKRNYISGILSRDKERFHGIRHRGWWLRELGRCPDDPPEELVVVDPTVEGEASTTTIEPRQTSEGDQRGPVNPWSGGGT